MVQLINVATSMRHDNSNLGGKRTKGRAFHKYYS